MASPPVIEDPAQASRRAKVRIGVAITLLITAIGILAVLNQNKGAKEAVPEAVTPPAPASISSQETEKPAEPQPPQISGMSSPPVTTAPEPTVEPAPVTPPRHQYRENCQRHQSQKYRHPRCHQWKK